MLLNTAYFTTAAIEVQQRKNNWIDLIRLNDRRIDWFLWTMWSDAFEQLSAEPNFLQSKLADTAAGKNWFLLRICKKRQ